MGTVRSLHPSRRKQYRIKVPIRVDLNGRVLDTVDWSSGGFRIEGYLGPEPEETFDVTLSIPFQGYSISAEAPVILRRYEASTGTVAVEFGDVPERTRDLIDYFARGLLSGEMSNVEGAIRRLDTPVTPVETKVKRTAEELTLSYHIRRWLKYFAYLLVGLLLTWYVGSSVYYRVWRMEVTTATVAATVEELLSPADGQISEIFVGSGEWVKAGDPLFQVVDEDAMADQVTEDRRVQAAERALWEIEGRLDVEVQRLEVYRDVLEARNSASQAKLFHLQQQVRLLARERDRVQRLVAQGALSQSDVDIAEANHQAARAQAEIAMSEVEINAANLEAINQGFLFEGERLQANVPEMEVSLEMARAELLFAKQASNGRRTSEANIVVAPFDGRVATVYKSAMTTAKQGSTVLVLENTGARRVEAWLTPEESAYVKLHDTVQVDIRALGRSFEGRVMSLGTTPMDADKSRLMGKDPKLKAVIELSGLVGDDTSPAQFEAVMKELQVVDSVGLPVVVSFRRAWD